jgi:hypothetical protein
LPDFASTARAAAERRRSSKSALSSTNNIDFEQAELMTPPAGFAAIRLSAVDLPLAPF